MPYDPLPHLRAQLERLDRCIEREILRMRARYQLSLDEFRGLYVSDEQVDGLVRDSIAHAGLAGVAPEPLKDADAPDIAAGAQSPWATLATQLALQPLDLDLVLLALAPEIDLKYETLYAYLNNDVMRKWPTVDLAQRLLADGPERCSAIAAALSPAGALIKLGILDRIETPSGRPSLLNAGFALTPLVTQFLLGLPLTDARLSGVVDVVAECVSDDAAVDMAQRGDVSERLAQICRSSGPDGAAIVLSGEPGSGRERVAAVVCADLGIPLLRLEMDALRTEPDAGAGAMPALALRRRLEPCGLYLAGFSAFCGSGQMSAAERRCIDLLMRQPSPIFVPCEPHADAHHVLRVRRAVVVRIERGYSQCLALWDTLLHRAGVELTPAERRELASRLPLPARHVEETIATARDLATLTASPRIDAALLVAAARARTDQSIGSLAMKVDTRHGWDDLVLPSATRIRVQELASAVRNRHIVYEDWGFAGRIATGTGLKALFTGASGTGKTMTAGVIARDLGFDLYKIELSSVVSKYIGETEKNLDRIFRAVRAANAMLFIDEAEAILGKRSEVKDAHDRYANIEVAYLLQRLEEHDGVVILASNLKRNIDDAFARRMHYVIDFPVPDERHRKRLWRGMFPRQVPLGADVDFDFLAKQFELAGGDIRNVALDAAFLAAQNGRSITMTQLVQALARQLAKQGKMPSLAEFRQFHPLVAQWAAGSEA